MDFNSTHGQFEEQDVMDTEKRCNIMMQIGCYAGKNNQMSGISKLTTKTKNSKLLVLSYIERLKMSSTKKKLHEVMFRLTDTKKLPTE
jgi:hypothetical protein